MTSISKSINGTLLAIDTSTSSMSVALTRGGELLGELSSKAERNHSIHLIPLIQQLLSSAGIHPRELDAIAVGVGPGSYTGVRIGVTVAKTFAWTHGMDLLGVSSLEALALGGGAAFLTGTGVTPDSEQATLAADETLKTAATTEVTLGIVESGDYESAEAELSKQSETIWIVPMFEARRGQAFTGLYQASPQGWSCLIADGIRLMSDWSEELLERTRNVSGSDFVMPDRILFVGETDLHVEVLQKFFERWSGACGMVGNEMRARHIADIGRRHWRDGRIEQAHGLVPNYTQITEAEANLLAKKL
ncbi:tRNA (adenosine(37)-N6)-threonylcarbamoyltransferase complex dimerization subunit type 1 TsaB [Paenibacillus sp. LMG 31456]|uniref:tRNA (Adenosine(37)-N6)-threonylcarbamoyltransferase complex dimerization subunit type 1 TsaB n=1 Tax=Paenibacillus foliorum TaxID=2654974 RepID=A0A972H1N9_9BACL|nr:tRNA (adenosine(37)-N6)-threonylcarbamoyltransferase complex dimerization subunit type 1 TsaB [Paenibacillus foliorum]NOU94591.1 tRNA (adenosine(37)-N6)-threonylcarbamoyltransferase complex dimerization subunit type 1 TsaB [Paenibacillus foliorum]